MFQHTRLTQEQNIFQKIKNLDYILLISIIILSIISFFVMYSTDGGELLIHTKNHLAKLLIFFIMMLVISFVNIKLWHLGAYCGYSVVL